MFCWVLIIPIMGICQTGPGGVGASSNNVLWMSGDGDVYSDAGATLASDGDNVQQWNDRSGNGINAINITTNQQPTYRASVINGLPVIRFSTAGTDDRLLASGINDGTEASVFVVASYASLPSDNPGLIHAGPSGFNWGTNPDAKTVGVWVDDADGRVWGRAIENDGTRRDIPQVIVLNPNTYYIISTIIDDNGSNIDQYVNGATSGSSTMNDPLAEWVDFGIGCQGDEGWNGDVAEVIAYNTGLNRAQQVIVENYLAAKYNLSISNDFYDEDDNGDYDFEVAGIGQIGVSSQTNSQGTGIVRVLNPTGLQNNEFYIFGHDNGVLLGTNTTDVPSTVDSRLERVWRGSETGNITSFDVQFDLTGLGSVTASDLVLLVDSDDDGQFIDEATIGSATSVGGNVYQFSGVTGLNDNVRFTLGTSNSSATPLPITLVDFQATAFQHSVVINWTTSSESNNDYFTVERSKDGTDWEEIGKIQGSGTSSENKTYSLTDNKPVSGLNYYRLKQTDFDGATEVFRPVSVEIYQTHPVKLYPNPANDIIYMEYGGEGFRYALFNQLGQLVNVEELSSDFHSVKLDLSQLNEGIYYMKLWQNDRSENKKLVVRH